MGTWLIIDSCAGGIVIDPLGSCSGTTPTIQVTSFRNTGSLTFNADMTFQEAQTQSLTEAFQIPSTCLQETCDQYATGWKNVGDTANCTSSSAGCSCTWGQTQTTTESGIYRTSVTMFAVETEGGAGGTTEYCVQGTMLHLLSPAGGSDYDVVAQKQ